MPVSDEEKRWREERVKEALGRRSLRKDRFATLSGTEVPDLCVPEDQDESYMETLGFPGEFPYTRGVQPTMYRGRLWTMRMFAGFGTPRQTNERFKFLLAQGQTGLSTAFDFPTLMGYDSDSPLSLGEVGMVGVAVDTLRDMEILFDEIPLDEVTTSMTINGPAAVLLGFYIALADNRGIPRNRLGGTVQNDCLKEFIAQHAWVVPPRPAMRIVTDTIEYCTAEVPRWNTVSISGYHIREAGSTAAQELAFTIADGLEYVQWAVDRGLPVDDFAPRLSFFFDVHNDFFEEIAKFRAARRMWAKLMKARFAPQNPRSLMLRTHAQTAGVSLTAQQPYNNVARVALQGMAAVLGGTQSLHTNSLDETYALPTEEAVSVALRTQQIIAEESGVANTIDPLAGSYYVEWDDRSYRGRCHGIHPKDRRFGWYGRRGRAGLPAEGNRIVSVSNATRDREGRKNCSRRQQISKRRKTPNTHASNRRNDRKNSSSQLGECQNGTRQRPSSTGVTADRANLQVRYQRNAFDYRCSQSVLHRTGDLRRVSRGLRTAS